ncbi:ligninase H2 [Leptodontidium sp. MPI-SDFR-AT-0119]|nr:ligninase H2 [Leptodontidium sp. MPI-SDFR-AT-0119]
MKLSLIPLLTPYILSTAIAWPGMTNTLSQLNTRLSTRQDSPEDSNELIGDLVPEKGGPQTPVGIAIYGILTGTVDGQGLTEWSGSLPGKNTAKCKADTCCIWRHISLDMEKKFKGRSGRCNKWARFAVRLGFHDAGTWSKYTEDFGGADGSIILSGEELSRGENNGLQDIAKQMQKWYAEYSKFGVGMADLIQMGATVAAVVCPLGPRTRSFVGRIDSSRPAVNGLLPDVHAEAEELINLFENKTIRAHGLTALLGAHTTSQQHFVDPARARDPQDSTPGIWDVLFYNQTTGSAPKRVFRLPSDVKIAAHPKAALEWSQFATDQEHWNTDYAREYVRLSLLGVNNINSLTECTHVLPRRILTAKTDDNNAAIQKWLKGEKNQLSSVLEEGDPVPNVARRRN